ncbi:hypothetical protein LCGC14_0753030 [marine sediment metagenome]|uniref:Uncharacterized protein n=1 Tax=marine sediment metagenome TaxID=412755 RepID=A0A0F9Q7Q0_9ZZZZ
MHKRRKKGSGDPGTGKQRMYERLFNEQLKKVSALRATLVVARKKITELSGIVTAFQEGQANRYEVALTEEEMIVLADGDRDVSDMLADQVLALARARSIM